MATAIQFLRSSIASLRPSPPSLSDGMPMVNFNASDPGLYFKLNDQSLMKVGPTSIGESAPNYNATGYEVLSKGEMWLDTTLADDKPRPVLKLWDGTTWTAAGGSIQSSELPQPKGTVLAGPVTDPDSVPTFRPLEDSDLPNVIDPSRLGGFEDGNLLIGGEVGGFAESALTLGDNSLKTTVGENALTIEVTAGNIAGKGSDGTIKTGDGHIQLNYDGLYSADNRFKFLTATGTLVSYGPTELGQNPLVDTHTIIGATTISGDVELTNVYSLTVGGDLFVGHNVQIGSDTNELLKVYNKSEFYSDIFVKDSKTVDIDGYLTVQRSTVLGTTDTDTLTVNATTTIPAAVTIGRNCTQETFTVKSNSVFECDVTVSGELTTTGNAEFPGDVVLGTSCSDFVAIQGTQLNTCDVFIGSNVPNANAEQVTIEAATGNITTKGQVKVTEKLIVSSPVTDENLTVDGSTGDVLAKGTITTTSGFIGDGSQLFNLAVPNAMFFMGDIDATTASAPASANSGDFYLYTVNGNVSVGWPDIAGLPINQDQFIYYSQTGVGSFKWGLGSVQNNQGFVTLNTAQNIAGSKTFSAPAQFTSTVNVTGDATFASKVTVQGATQLDDTLTVANNQATVLGGTLEVLGASVIRDTLTVEDATALSATLGVVGASTLSGATTLGSTLVVTGDSTTLLAVKDCSKEALLVNGLSTFECKATFNGGIDMGPNSDLGVGGNLTVGGNTTLGTSCASSTLTVTAVTTIECDTSILKKLSVTGITTLSDTLTVTGATTLNSTLSVTGITTVGGTLTVTGNTTLNNTLTVAADKSTTLGGNLTVAADKATALGGTLAVSKATTLSDTLTVSKATQLNETLTVADSKATVLGGTLQVKEASTFNETVSVDPGKAATFGGTVTVTDSTTTLFTLVDCASQALVVNGLSTFNCSATFTEGISIPSGKDLVVGGNLTVNGNTTLGSSCASDTFTVTAVTNINCAATIANTLTVSGDHATTLGGTLTVTGNSVLSGTLGVTGVITASGGVTGALTGNATTATTLQTARTLTVGSTGKSFNGSADVSWSLAEIGVNDTGINFNAGNGLDSTGDNATANQSATTTKTFTVKAADSSITVDATGIKVNGGVVVSGNADKLTNPRLLWGQSFNGTANVSGNLTNTGDITPSTDGGGNLGSASLRYANLYTQDMHFSNEGTAGNSVDGTTGDWTLQEGNDQIYFINNKTGAKFRVVMEPVG